MIETRLKTLRHQMEKFEALAYEASEVVDTCLVAMNRIATTRARADALEHSKAKIQILSDCEISLISQKIRLRNARDLLAKAEIELAYIYQEITDRYGEHVKPKIKLNESEAA